MDFEHWHKNIFDQFTRENSNILIFLPFKIVAKSKLTFLDVIYTIWIFRQKNGLLTHCARTWENCILLLLLLPPPRLNFNFPSFSSAFPTNFQPILQTLKDPKRLKLVLKVFFTKLLFRWFWSRFSLQCKKYLKVSIATLHSVSNISERPNIRFGSVNSAEWLLRYDSVIRQIYWSYRIIPNRILILLFKDKSKIWPEI